MTRLSRWTALPDPEQEGVAAGWSRSVPPSAVVAPVPGIIGQAFPDHAGVAWYWTAAPVPDAAPAGHRVVIRFGAVDHRATVWCNGTLLGTHDNGESPFELDLTDALDGSDAALIAVRVVIPTEQPIDDLVLAEIPHRNKRGEGHHPGWLHNHGGILLPVELEVVPAVRVTDIHARPDPADGAIHVALTLRNDTGGQVAARLAVGAGPDATGAQDSRHGVDLALAPGDQVHRLELPIADPRPWDIDDPFLYRVSTRLDATLAPGVTTTDDRAVRCGFRDFRVIDGWFHLNGRRIFLRSSHSGNHVPVGQIVPPTADMVRRDVINAKASGFNAIRFMAGVAWPEQLDFCDEIGLLVYEEPMAGWLLKDSPHMTERYDRSLREMILRDRNHPSVAVWGLLTESPDTPVFRHAVTRLDLVRELDPSRLVILNSGRFDAKSSIGSVSNPGGHAWEHTWGREAPDGPDRTLTPDPATGWLTTAAWINGDLSLAGAIEGNPDTHTYPLVPHAPEAIAFLRTLGQGTKPHMLSEYGIGSLMNVIGESRQYEQHGARPDLLDAALIRSMAERFERDWLAYGLDGVYPFAEDMLIEAQRAHGRYRALGFDIVRSNPQLPGFNVTGLLDHALTGEGFWTFWRHWKPGIVDVLWDGWSPLRWCLFAEPLHVHPGRDVRLEAVLATEDVLAPGAYPARFRLSGPDGVAWEDERPVVIPQAPPGRGPLAVPALDVTIAAPDAPGSHVFAAELRQGRPAGGRRTLTVSDPGTLATPGVRVTTWGVEARVVDWLRGHGAVVSSLEDDLEAEASVILIGVPDPGSSTADAWRRLTERIAGGASALFLDPAAFQRDADPLGWLPLRHDGRCEPFYDWVYHREWVGRRHAMLAGLSGPGVLDWDLFGPLLAREMFEDLPPCDDVAIAAFAVGYSKPGGYASGLVAGSYDIGAGRILLNALRLLPLVDRHPAADRIMLNLIEWARATAVAAADRR